MTLGGGVVMDIVERLRAVSQGYVVLLNDHGVYTEAADEIERLREALRLERQLKDDALRAFNEARAVLKDNP